jgi:transketolase
MLKKISQHIRQNIVKLSHFSNTSHIGSSLSAIDILVVIYFKFIKFNQKNRNIFILSKGHACLGLYCLLYEIKKISKKTLLSFGKNNTILMSHASHKVPGVDFSTGSLGHGLPVGTGIALASKIKKIKKKVFVLISDGELNEGSTWEALLFSVHHKLNNLIVIIDYNKIQSLDWVKNVLKIEPLKQKLKSFGLNVLILDGHNHAQIFQKLNKIDSSKPTVIIANTIKGKGISFMQNKILWHYRAPNKYELKLALRELK